MKPPPPRWNPIRTAPRQPYRFIELVFRENGQTFGVGYRFRWINERWETDKGLTPPKCYQVIGWIE